MAALSPQEQLFVNYNYVRGVRKFLKEANLIKQAMAEEEEMTDDASVAQAMISEGIEAPAEEAMEENQVLEVANALVELAQETQDPQTAVQLEGAAEALAAAAGVGGEAAVAPEAAAAAAAAPIPEEVAAAPMEEEIKEAAKIAAAIKAGGMVDSSDAGRTTNNDPSQVADLQRKDYDKGQGNTNLKTEKGEIGDKENVDDKIVQPEIQDANIEQVTESKDIHGKDYAAPGQGGTTLKTEQGEVGAQANVEGKINPEKEASAQSRQELAKLAMEKTLAAVLGK